MWVRYAVALLLALALGLWAGAWIVKREVDSRDLVTLVSILGTVAIALYTVRSNREGDRGRQEHEERMQKDRLTEERARLQREDGVEQLIDLKRQLRRANPTHVDFGAYSHPEGITDEERGKLIDRASRGWNSVLETSGMTDWFSMLGWTRDIRNTGDRLSPALTALEDAWLDLFHDYARPPSPPDGLENPQTYQDALGGAWASVGSLLSELEDLVRNS